MKLHSYLSPKCLVKGDDVYKGVFAKENIRGAELIAVWGGIVYSTEDIEKIGKEYPHFLTHPVSVYDGFFLGSINNTDMDDVEFMNHSCEPNAGIRGQIVLVARQDIFAGQEICFDYETTETDSGSFECNCGSRNCRKLIDGNAWKDLDFQKKNEGYFSLYIEEKIKTLKC